MEIKALKLNWRNSSDIVGIEELDIKLPEIIKSLEATKSIFFEIEREKKTLKDLTKGIKQGSKQSI